MSHRTVTMRNLHTNALKEVVVEGFDPHQRVLIVRWGFSGLYDVALSNGQGKGHLSTWQLIPDDLSEVRKEAEAQGIKLPPQTYSPRGLRRAPRAPQLKPPPESRSSIGAGSDSEPLFARRSR